MKKVLTIVLSVAMVICLMPAMAFAADATTTADNTTKATGLAQFSDADSITNKEAVSVLTGLHIINGMGDGTFQPKGDVTRAQTATMISILVRGGDTASLKAPSKDPFTDVAKDNWAAPYVAYGADQGYINGMGDGTYAPNNNVTTAQLATILDQILGYSKADVAYQWPENAMAKANEAGLLVNVNKSANDNLDREEAAQMIFNALKATDVVKDTTTGTNGETTYKPVKNDSKLDYQGRVEKTVQDNDGNKVTIPGDTEEQLIEKLFPKATYKDENADPFGRTSKVWKNGRDKISDDITETPVLTYTSEQELKDLQKDLDGYDIEANAYENSKTPTGIFDEDSEIQEATGNGVLVELYANEKDNAIVKAVVATYDPEEVTDIAKDGTIELGEDSIAKTDKVYDSVKDAVKGDRILVAEDANGNKIDAYVATSVKGIVSAVSKDKNNVVESVTLGGKEYSFSDPDHRGDVSGLTVNATKEQNAYLDKYGYIVDSSEVTAEQAKPVPANFLYVTGVRKVENKAENDPYVTADKPSYSYYMRAVDENGNVIDDKEIVIKDKNDPAKKSLDPAEEFASVWTTKPGQDLGVYAFVETAGGYALYKANPANEVSGSGKATADNAIDAKTTTIEGYYVASDVKTISISVDEKTAKVSATAENGADVKAGTDYAYVWKKPGSNAAVTTIFVKAETNTTPSNLVYVVKATGNEALYDGFGADGKTVEQKKGIEVEYYTADSNEAQKMFVKENTYDHGFQMATADNKGFTLATPSDKDLANVKKDKKVTSAYADKNQVTIDGTVYTLTDKAIRDVQAQPTDPNETVTNITSVAELEKAAANTKQEVKVDFVKGENNTITQLYVTKVAPTK